MQTNLSWLHCRGRQVEYGAVPRPPLLATHAQLKSRSHQTDWTGDRWAVLAAYYGVPVVAAAAAAVTGAQKHNSLGEWTWWYR